MKLLNKPRGSGAGPAFFLACALLFTAISVLVFILTLNGGTVLEIAFVSIFVVVGLALIGAGIWRYFPKFRLSSPVLMISKTELQIGERFNVDYQQTFRIASEVSEASVCLIFRESATYTQGSSTRTEYQTVIVETHEIPGRRFEAGDVMRQSFSLTIPKEAMHTFIAKNNKLQWLVRVHVDIVGWPDLEEDYEIRVLAQKMWGI